jgi:L-threonylcarbamoyladenylate synthase
MENQIFAAAMAILSGEVVALPTETVYGLAANALDDLAVGKIFKIKGRPFCDPLILHLLDDSWVEKYGDVDEYGGRVGKLADAFWPGPLTVVLKKRKIVGDIVTAGLPTVAMRCPNHRLFLEILRLTQVPLAAPSANPFGYVSPTAADHVRATLGNAVSIIVDGGPCSVGVESTIVDVSCASPKILRPGKITVADIANVLGEVVIDYAPIIVETPSAPGQLRQHYCTNTPLLLFDHRCEQVPIAANRRSAIVFCQKPADIDAVPAVDVFWLSEDGDLCTIAKNLFAVLQRLDAKGYGVILCERPRRTGIGIAVDDRLLRAAAKFN